MPLFRDRVSIKDVAQAAQVSRSTAQYALSGGGRISEKTRQRVREVARELGYRPNRLASGLRRQRSSTVGVVVTTINSPVFSAVVDGIQQVVEAHDYIPLLGCSQGDPTQEVRMVEALLASRVDGLIVLPAHPHENTAYYQNLLAEGVSLVFVVRRMPEVSADSVCNDNEQSGYLCARHLAKLGRKHLAFLTSRALLECSSAIQERLVGCNRALAELSLPPAELVGPDYPHVEPGEQFAFEVVTDCLRSELTFDGLVAAHDGLAYGALGALAQAGVAVPGQVSVVGCDDLYPSAFWNPPLTTIRQQAEQIGAQAARLLFENLQYQGKQPLAPRRVQLQPTLIVRGSCGAVPQVTNPKGGDAR